MAADDQLANNVPTESFADPMDPGRESEDLIRRAEYWKRLHANPEGEVPADLWSQGQAFKATMHPPRPQDEDPGPGPAGSAHIAALSGQPLTLTEAEDPAPRTSFGSLGRFVRVDVPPSFPLTTVRVPVDPKQFAGLSAETLRLFRWDPANQRLTMVASSGLGSDGTYVWGKIRESGVYGVYGLPSDPSHLLTVHMLFLAREHGRLAGVAGVDSSRLKELVANLAPDRAEAAVGQELPEFQILLDRAPLQLPAFPSWPPWQFCSQWTSMGPTNIAGRVQALAFHPSGSIVYAGAGEGGVWKSNDGGNSWYPVMDRELSLAIGTVAVAPSSSDTIYAGTGEYIPRWWWAASTYPGVGVYRSTQGGGSWRLMPPISSSRCSKIVVHPSDPTRVYVAGDWGIDRWSEATQSWTEISNADVSDIVLDPGNPQRLYAAVETADGIIKTDNAEAATPTWVPFNGGMTFPSGVPHFAKLAISQSNPSVLYATVNAEDASGNNIGAALYRWDGTSWVDKGIRIDSTQQMWNNVLAVHPTDPNHIIAGGVWLGWSPDGGDHWYGRSPGHTDNHAVAFNPVDPSRTLLGNDGGIWTNRDPGTIPSDFVGVYAPELGGLDIFSCAGGNLWHRWWRPGSGWGGWENLGGAVRGRPAAVHSGSGGIDVFARGMDNQLWRRSWRPFYGWLSWFPGGGSLGGDPVALFSPDSLGAVDVFVRGSDNAVWHAYWLGFYPFPPFIGPPIWETLGGITPSDPGALYSPDSRGMDVFVRGLDNGLWHNHWQRRIFPPGGSWGGWTSLGGQLNSKPTAVASSALGGMDVFGRMNRALGHWAWRPTSGWSAWTNLGHDITGDPMAHFSPEMNPVDVYARGRAGDLRHIFLPASGIWQDESLGGGIPNSPAAVRSPDLGGVDLFVRGLDNQMYHRWSRGLGTAWGGYEGLGQDFASDYLDANNQLVTTQFYTFGVAKSPPFSIGGNTQDQGILKSDGSGTYIGMGGNEGGFFVVDPNNGNTIYWNAWDIAQLLRTDSGGPAGARDATNGITPWTGIGALAIQPGNSNVLVCATGNNRIYYSSDGAATPPGTGWQMVVANTADGVSRIVFAPSAPQRAYFATGGGRVWRSDDGGQNWSVISGPTLPVGNIWGLTVDWNNRDVVFLTHAGTATGFGHVWLSTDGGVTWQDISGARPYTRLPDLAFYSIAQHRYQPDTLYVATDSGVYKTTDRGDWWYAYDEGLPNAILTAIDYSPYWNSLFVSTIGRGLWTRPV